MFCTFPMHLIYKHRISAYFLGPVDEQYNRIAYPPIYAHHIHVYQEGNVDFHMFTTHGDFATDDATSYWTRSAPNTCFVPSYDPDSTMIMYALLVNVKNASVTAAVLLNFTLSADACQAVNRGWIHSPRQHFDFATYAVPSTLTMSWWSTVWPFSGTVTHANYHSHQMRFKQMFALRGMLASYINVEELGTNRTSSNFTVSIDQGATSEISDLLSKYCFASAKHSSTFINGSHYERRSDVAISHGVTLRVNDVVTIVAFHQGYWSLSEDIKAHDVLWVEVLSPTNVSKSLALPAMDVLSQARQMSYNVSDPGGVWERDALLQIRETSPGNSLPPLASQRSSSMDNTGRS